MRDLGAGFGYLVKGQRWVSRRGSRMRTGLLLPPLITLGLYAVALVVLGFWADDITAWATPFADGWDSPWQGLLRTTLTVLLFVGGLFFAVVSFAAVTLLVGQPFYEALAERVDESEGGAPAGPELPLWRELLISAWDSLRVLLWAALFGAALFVLGFVPVVGQSVVPVVGVCVSGFFLAVELAGVALVRRGVPLKERFRLLRGRMMLTLGFGVPLALAFLVPFVAVFLMPGAVAGATLLARELVPPVAEPPGAGGEGPGAADASARPATAPWPPVPPVPPAG
ncbi:EI24 domain-containing protein [Streptomyces sp. F63]|uniref:EI24 domain-containing protein n=1 Tax=Streptomyces sp. F63 TaxID=2824887 RepID=UPI001B390D3D|nr:EI24 domain-containing protein [Streptomyces sp. F63]MBQ0984854.1 EI24 domain-containing protein [Streptomyces sp. F63]